MDRYHYVKDNIEGKDQHWYAVDLEDRIAEFWTCGNLPMPGLIGHNDIQRIEYYADILHRNDGTKNSPAGSDTLLNFYAFDDCGEIRPAGFPYWRREFSGSLVSLSDLPDEIRQSFKIRLPVSFASDEKIPRSVIPEPIDVSVKFIERNESIETVRQTAEEGTHLWKEMQQRFQLRFEKKHDAYFLLSDPPEAEQYFVPFCPECFENFGIYYPWLVTSFDGGGVHDTSGKRLNPIADMVWHCKNCEKDFTNPPHWPHFHVPVEGIPEGSCGIVDLKLTSIPNSVGFWQTLKKRLFG